jgi:hypothetical protein
VVCSVPTCFELFVEFGFSVPVAPYRMGVGDGELVTIGPVKFTASSSITVANAPLPFVR